MESTSTSASTITQTEFVQIFFRNSVHLSDFRRKRSPGLCLSGGLAIDGLVSLFTEIHAEIIVKAVLSLLGSELPTFLEWDTVKASTGLDSTTCTKR